VFHEYDWISHDVDYSEFWVEKTDIDYLQGVSFKIKKLKEKHRSTSDLEDEIDAHFVNG